MAKDKLRKFAEFKSFPNCFEFPVHLKGKWRQEVFRNPHPLVLELGCGKGEYSVALAAAFPEKNFIGIDLKSNRMWTGAKIALEQNLSQVAFIRMIIGKITDHFEAGEVDEIWITFPDPFPKDRHEKHRLTHPNFLNLYKQVLNPGGKIHLKTDDDGLFDYTESVLKELNLPLEEIIRDVHGNPEANSHLRNITTHYENLFRNRGRTIKYLRFSF